MLCRRQGRRGRRVVFAFAGECSAGRRIGQALYETEPVVRATVDACDRVARELGVPVAEGFRAGKPLRTADRDTDQRFEIVRIGVVQLALCDLWAAAGVTPDATLSVSLGEIACAYACGALTREEVVAVLCSVGRVAAASQCDGMTYTLDADSTTARGVCRAAPRRLDFIGEAAPGRSMARAAPEDSHENELFLDARGIVLERHPSAWPCHTAPPWHDRATLERELADLRPRRPRIPTFSAVGGRDIARDGGFDALHWHWMIGHPFWYGEATRAALRDGPAIVVNIGVHDYTTPWIRQTAARLGIDVPIVTSTRPAAESRAWTRAPVAVARWRPSRRSPRNGGRGGGEASQSADIDLAGADLVRDPFPYFERLRRAGPVHHLAVHDAWLVVTDREVREAFGQPELFSSRLLAPLDLGLLAADPPGHTLNRRELSERFDPTTLSSLRALAHDTAKETLDAFAGEPELDVVGDFAAPLGERVAGRLLGLDDGQIAHLRAAAGDPERDPSELVGSLTAALSGVIPDPKPVDRLLWLAGTTTTKRLITAAVMILLEDQALRSRVSRDARLLLPFLEEAVRLHPPERLLPRVTTADVILGGVPIPSGSVVYLCVASANRDPARFEHPDDIDLNRRSSSLAFGAGPHRCPGRRLARIEAEAAISALLAQMPNFFAAQPPCALRWIPSASAHGLEQLLIAPGVRETA